MYNLPRIVRDHTPTFQAAGTQIPDTSGNSYLITFLVNTILDVLGGVSEDKRSLMVIAVASAHFYKSSIWDNQPYYKRDPELLRMLDELIELYNDMAANFSGSTLINRGYMEHDSSSYNLTFVKKEK